MLVRPLRSPLGIWFTAMSAIATMTLVPRSVIPVLRKYDLALVAQMVCFLGSAAVGADHFAWRLSFTGFGGLKVGMTVPQAEEALDIKLQEDLGPDDDPAGCHYAQNESKLPGIGLMVEARRVVRIDVTDSRYRTRSGARVGMTEAEVLRLHPRIVRQPHHYDEDGHYLVLTTPDQRFALLFETDGKVVTDIRAGLREPVGYVERCL